MARSRIVNVRCEPAGASDQARFTLVVTARVEPVGTDLRYVVSHRGGRLIVTDLTMSSSGRSGLDGHLPGPSVAALAAAVTEWVVTKGDPDGYPTEWRRERGEPDPTEHDWWVSNLATFVELVTSPTTRARVRDDDYRRDLAAEYVELATSEGAPRDALAERRNKSVSGIAADLRLAREAGWLAKTRRGARGGIRPGPELLRYWREHGWPDFYPDPWELDDGPDEIDDLTTTDHDDPPPPTDTTTGETDR